MFRKSPFGVTFAVCLGMAATAGAQASGSLTVTATVASSIAVAVEPANPAAGSPATLSSVVHVMTANAIGDECFAQLELQPAPGVTWRVNGEPVGSSVGLRLTHWDGWTRSHTMSLLVARHASVLPVENTIRFTVVGD